MVGASARPEGGIRVLFVTMAFPAISEAFAGVEVRALTRQGAIVEVAALRPPGKDSVATLREWNVDTSTVSYYRARTLPAFFVYALASPVRTFSTLAWLVRFCYHRPVLLAKCLVFFPRLIEVFARASQRPPDVLHLFWGHFPSVLGYMVQRWLPQSVVSVSLGAYDLLYDFPPSRRVARRADCVWTHAEANRQAILALQVDPSRVHVAIRGVDLSVIPQRRPARAPHRVTTAGRLIPEKGMGEVMRAVASLAGTYPDIELVVLGDGPDRGRLEGLAVALGISERVLFRGAVTHREIFEVLCGTSVFMLLSCWSSERLPNVAKEALSCGCLCVLSRTPGIEEILTDLQFPMVVEADDWRGAAALVAEVFDTPARFEPDRRRAVEFSLRCLDADEVARRRLDVWRHSLSLKNQIRRSGTC